MVQSAGMTETTMQILEQLLKESSAEEMMSSGLELLAGALKSEAGALWVPGEKENQLYPAFCVGPVELTAGTDTGIEGAVFRDGKPRLIPGEAEETETAFNRAGFPLRSGICVPLKTRKKVLGSLIIVNRRDGSVYTPAEQLLCGRIAALIAMAMEEESYVYRVPEKKEVLLRARGIVKDFPSGDEKLRVLKGIDLDIYKGEFVVLLGESGCGKSTLVNVIAGMDQMTEGTLEVEGRDLSHPTDRELTAFRRSDVGFVFQNYNLMPNLTALENVRFLAELVPDPMLAEEALEKVGLADRADHFPSMLSGGQQQRVSIARAIVKKPKLIFADEPTAALDYRTSIEVLSVFEEIVRSQETTVVMITHNPEIARMADRVIRIRDGRIAGVKTNRQPVRARELVW